MRASWILLLLAVACLHQPASAASITDLGSTVRPNNDDVRGRGNPNVRRMGTLWLGLDGRAETPFAVADSGGTTEYAISVQVTNYSGHHWAGYRFVLGLDGERDGPPVLSRAGDGFGFDMPSDPRDVRPESDGSLFLSGHSEDTLDFTGSFLQRDTVRFTFSFDLPDHLHVRRVWLLEQPAPVPEPGGFALLAVGLGALALRRRLQTPAPIARALRPIR